jgi:hypothetical protein
MWSSSSFLLLLGLLLLCGYLLYQKQLKEKKGDAPMNRHPEVIMTILPNQHRNIVINYDTHHNAQKEIQGKWLLVYLLPVSLGIGFGYGLYRVWQF